MTAYISDIKGGTHRLPALLSWDFAHSAEGSADAFEATFFYSPEMAGILGSAVRFWAEHEGKRVFTGVVDEFTAGAGKGGMTVSVNGRGFAALLMDNEAEAAEYRGATLDFILDRHVRPYGVEKLRAGNSLPAANFSVSSGESNWAVLREYCRFCVGTEPRFDADGTLLLDASGGEKREINASTAIVSQTWRKTREGAVSEVLVKNRGAAVTVENAGFKASGGSARRVVNVPRRTGCDAMRYTGEWQIAQSMRDYEMVTLTLPAPFAAFAGDRVTLHGSPLGVTGDFTAAESRTRGGPEGAATTLKLRRK